MDGKINRVHIIAMGGSVMHALAITLKNQGIEVSGSDDDFFDPSKARLEEHGLLPERNGWFPEKIDESIDIILLGMHAHADNTELAKAQELNLTIYSLPEFIFKQSLNKQRIVIAGSHGKTTITSIIMHVLKFHKRDFDYLVGAKVKGFDETVKLSKSPVIIIEGDEYLSSRIDDTPKFLHYHHHIGLLSGIAWDHVNVFPTEDEYVHQFDLFADATPKAGSLAYNDEDPLANVIGGADRTDVIPLPYTTHASEIIDGITYLVYGEDRIKLKIFGKHNLLNLSGAMAVLARLSISNTDFYDAIKSFELPFLRLNVLSQENDFIVFRDYAHAPSKVEATAIAVKTQYPDRDLLGVFELHTYSSLNKAFFTRYKGTLKYCNQVIVYYNPKAVEQKKLEPFAPADVEKAFNHPHLTVINEVDELKNKLLNLDLANMNILLMSSANFGGLDLDNIF